jgi:hypothetical protein
MRKLLRFSFGGVMFLWSENGLVLPPNVVGDSLQTLTKCDVDITVRAASGHIVRVACLSSWDAAQEHIAKDRTQPSSTSEL